MDMINNGFDYTQYKNDAEYRSSLIIVFSHQQGKKGTVYTLSSIDFIDGYQPIVRTNKNGSFTWIY